MTSRQRPGESSANNGRPASMRKKTMHSQNVQNAIMNTSSRLGGPSCETSGRSAQKKNQYRNVYGMAWSTNTRILNATALALPFNFFISPFLIDLMSMLNADVIRLTTAAATMLFAMSLIEKFMGVPFAWFDDLELVILRETERPPFNWPAGREA